jgi:hypothetical protein
MEVNAVLVLRVLVLEIVGESRNRRKFVARLRIEVGVATAAVDCPVADAEVGQAGSRSAPTIGRDFVRMCG